MTTNKEMPDNLKIENVLLKGQAHPANGEYVPIEKYNALTAENARLREALEFYADITNYPLPPSGPLGGSCALEIDMGDKAIKALNASKDLTHPETNVKNRPKNEHEWLPIESAPKDGTKVLVFVDMATDPVVKIAWYRNAEEWEKSGKYCGVWDNLEDWEGWWSYIENSISQHKLTGYKKPTHWMPLPPPPNCALSGEGE